MSQLEQGTIKGIKELGTKLRAYDMDLVSNDTVLGKGTKIGTIKGVKELGTKLRTQDMDLGSNDTVLGKGTKIGTVSM